MENTLFTQLYKYREREAKHNLEDWLTECLAAIFRALPYDLLAKILSDLTDQQESAISAIAPRLIFKTQLETKDYGRPDMVVFMAPEVTSALAPKTRGTEIGGAETPKLSAPEPWLLFENKVGHHVDEQDLGEGQKENQLQRYSQWLSAQGFSDAELRQALLFVTHFTSPPDGFTDQADDSYSKIGADNRKVWSWGKIGKMLDELTAEEATEEPGTALHYRALIEAYNTYLEEHDMASEYPEYKDFAAFENYTNVRQGFITLVDAAMDSIGSFEDFTGVNSNARESYNQAQISAWKNLARFREGKAGAFVETGIWWPGCGDGWITEVLKKKRDYKETGDEVGLEPKFFVRLGHDNANSLPDLEGLSLNGSHESKDKDAWFKYAHGYVVLRSLFDFPAAPEPRSMEVCEWSARKGNELRVALAKHTQKPMPA